MVRRFGTLIEVTPSLRAYQSDMMDQFTAVAAAILAERTGMSPDDPEPQITATALLGLWRIQFQSLSKYLDGTRAPAQVHQAVTADVRRAAQLIETGLSSFAVLASPRTRPVASALVMRPTCGGCPGSLHREVGDDPVIVGVEVALEDRDGFGTFGIIELNLDEDLRQMPLHQLVEPLWAT